MINANGFAHAADRVGATASFLCALHCAALPFLLAALPTVGLAFLADHAFERIFVGCASVLALVFLLRGYRQHRDARALALLAPGLLLLWLGAFVIDGHAAVGAHALLVSTGGGCVAFAHLVNLRRSKVQTSVQA